MIYFITAQSQINPEFQSCSIPEVVEYFRDKNEMQVDTETQGEFNFKNQVLTLQLGDDENQFVIDFQHLSAREKALINDELFMNAKLTKLLHNAKFDIKFFWFHGMDIVNVYDTMIAEVILNAGRDVEKGFYSLYGACKRYCGVELDKETRGIINKLGLSTRVIQYAANDVKYLSKIKEQQMRKMISYRLAVEDHQDIYTVCGLEMNSVITFASFEYNGMKLDRARWKPVKEKIHRLVDSTIKEIDQVVNNEPKLKKFTKIYQDLFTEAYNTTTVNWSSPTQKLKVLQALFPEIKSTKALELAKYKNRHPIVNKLLEYNKAVKLSSSFGDTMEAFINPVTGRIHTDFWQMVSTGRPSSKEPNMLQIPARTEIGKDMRACFVPEPGYAIVGGDYSGCELRIIAEFSEDPIWVNAYKEGKDLHSELCAMTFDIPLSDVKKPSSFKPDLIYRDIQKTIDFGLAYGMSEYKLADTMEVSVDVASSVIKKFFSRVPKVKAFLDMLGHLGKTRGFIRTPKPYQRIRWFDGYENSDDFKKQGEIERAAKNTPIQGCNADMTKLACILIYREIKKNNYPVKLLIPVYDEIQTECKIEFAEEWASIMSKLMIQAAEVILKNVPMEVDCKVSDHWSK